MSNPKSQNFIIPFIIYPFDVMVSVNQTDDELLKSVKQFGLNRNDISEILNLHETVKARTLMLLTTNQTFIRLKSKPKKASEYGTLQHEIFHAIDFIFRKIGISLSADSDEAYAYLIGYLTEKIYEKLK